MVSPAASHLGYHGFPTLMDFKLEPVGTLVEYAVTTGHCHTPPVLASLEGSTQPEPTAGAGQAHQGVAPLPVTDTQPLLGGQGKQSCHHSNYHVSSPSDKPRMSRNLPGFHVMLSAIPFVNDGLSCSTAEHQGAERGCVTCHKTQKNRNKNKQDRIKPPRLYQRGQNEEKFCCCF
uniref:Uncharacterized protein n=1 Tax=Mus musculus TaxID=10090 RepID=Q3V0W9_MOUSE|nr:unnamed protein product [Mus musculus]|eukprot:NP_001028986.1 uncharacterized protein LOC619318 [Mus musculus]